MRNRKLGAVGTKALSSLASVLVGVATGCDGNVNGWSVLPNFPGDAALDASVTESAAQEDSGGATESSGRVQTGGVSVIPQDAAGSAPGIDASVTSGTGSSSCDGTCSLEPTGADAALSEQDASFPADGGVAGDGGLAVCGDGVVDGTEACDPPNAEQRCGSACVFLPPRCGDGVFQPEDGEGCDDGNETPEDGCFECVSSCGNGEIDPGETCEPGFAKLLCELSNTSTCIPCSVGATDCETRDVCDALTCRGTAACGNGLVETGERCDPPGKGRCTAACQLMAIECGNGFREPGEECDPPDGESCSDTCMHMGCGNFVVDGQEECDPPNGLTCDASCRTMLACVPGPAPASLLPIDGGFTTDVTGWAVTDARVTATHSPIEGVSAPGALLLELDNAAPGGPDVEIQGASICVPVSPNSAYTFAGWYKFPAAVTPDSGTSVSLAFYPNLSCTGDPIEASQVIGQRRPFWDAWQRYAVSLTTPVSEGASEVLSLQIKVGVWRPAEAAAVSVLWDDVQLTPEGEGYCGDCKITDVETCDDGNRLGGDGCSLLCLTEGCPNGVLDEGEQCDDGDLEFNDECDPDCTTGDPCRACAFAECNDVATACYQDSILVEAGVGAGKTVGQLCSGLAACIERTGCALDTASSSLEGLLDTGNSVESCYCGTARSEDCLAPGGPNGSCKLEIEAAVETNDPVQVVQRMGISGGGLYPAFQNAVALWSCASDPFKTCATSCVAEPACGNGKVGDRPPTFLTTQPGTFDGTGAGEATCAELGNASCFYEQCDDGNALEGDGCDAHCYREECGNGVLQSNSGELCDDGNTEPDDGCSATCQGEWVCGDSIVDPNEDCDGNDGPEYTCDDQCFFEVCGNGILQVNEECDPPDGATCLEGCTRAPLEGCTECLMEMGNQLADEVVCPGSVLLDGDPDADVWYQCLADPECSAVWDCLIESQCGLSGVINSCYCGDGLENLEACSRDSTFVPQGACVAQMNAAYESAIGAPPASNLDLLGVLLNLFNAVDVKTLSAATFTYNYCFAQPEARTQFDVDMCYKGLSAERRVECSQACFGEMALTEQEIWNSDCPPQ